MQFCIHQSIGTTVLFRQSGQKHPQNNNNFCRPKEWTYQMWPTSSVTRLGEIRHFGKIFKVLGNILTVYLLLGKFSGLLRQISYAIGQIFIDVNGQMLKNNLATWSHCRPDTHSCTVSIPNPFSLSLFHAHTHTHPHYEKTRPPRTTKNWRLRQRPVLFRKWLLQRCSRWTPLSKLYLPAATTSGFHQRT